MKYNIYLFDLDGTLINTSKIHQLAQIKAVEYISGFNIYENKKMFEIFKKSITTKDKLKILCKNNFIDESNIIKIINKKREITINYINTLKNDKIKINLFSFLKKEGCKIGIVTNSNSEASTLILKKMGIYNFIDIIISNNDVKNTKPHPEPYIRAISYFGGNIDNYIIFEDSETGLISARNTGCEVYHVKDIENINIKLIKKLNNFNDLNILIPMAGLGNRFKKRGFKTQKPLIQLNNKTLIEHSIDSLNITGNYIFIIRKDNNSNNKKLYKLLKDKLNNCKIIEIDYVTEGSASTCYLAKELINNNTPLLITNCDQILEWNSDIFLKKSKNIDCSVLTYNSTDKKNSFIKVDKNNIGLEIKEKEVISNNALVGVHYFKEGRDFISSYEEILKKKIKFKDEYYISTVCNNLIKRNKIVKNIQLLDNEKYYSTGTPDDYFNYLRIKGLLNTKIYNIKDMFRGWYVGNFEPSVFKTTNFEAGYLIHKKGEIWDVHYHEFIKEINFLVKGKMILNDIEINEGQIFIIDKNEIACPIFLEDCYIFVLKVPSKIGDKIII